MAVVVVLGGGGREHAMVDRLVRSPKVAKVFAIPGNAGIAREDKTHCVAIHHDNHEVRLVVLWWRYSCGESSSFIILYIITIGIISIIVNIMWP